ncbi:MAG: VWA domain-containing protein [Acidobacteria bacterium]|nr:VWA domain-containing protein [Acidobacteriota bacterium]
MRCAFLLSITIVLTATSGATGQQPAPTDPAAQPTFRAGVELVRLDVRVTGRDGSLVRDLRRDEVEVIEEGQPRPILLFQHIEEPTGSYVEVARRTIAGEVSTNRGAPRGHLYVLVFDQHHITPGNEQRARLAAERFLRHHVRPGDRVALYALPGPGPRIAFTADVGRAIAELAQVRGSLERVGSGVLGTMSLYEAHQIRRGDQLVLSRVANRLTSEAANIDIVRTGLRAGAPAGSQTDPAIFNRLVQEDARTIAGKADEDARRLLLMLSELMRELGAIEGRKAIMLLSEGFFLDNVSRELEETAAAAAKTYSVVYALDLNRREDNLRELQGVGTDQQSEIQSRLEPLGGLAVETDGRLIIDATGQLDAAFTRIAEESQDYYIVGFAPAPAALKDRRAYHRVSVKVTRSATRVSTRTGYALNAGDPTPADRRRGIDGALGAPFAQQGLPIELTTYVLGGTSPGAHKVVMSLSAQLPVFSSGERRPADVVFVARSARDGRIVASGTDTIALPEAAGPGSTTGRGSYRVQFEAPAGEYVMRVVIREPGGLVGSADRRFDVRPLDGRDVTASDLILGTTRDGLPVRATARPGEVLGGVVMVYGPTSDRLQDVAVTIELAQLGASAPVTTLHADLSDVQPFRSGASRTARIEMPLDDLPPGEYVARAIVKAGRETVAELMREVEILRGAPSLESTPTPAIRPLEILSGDIARRCIAALLAPDAAEMIRQAAEAALAGAWGKAESLLGPGHATEPAPSLILRGMVGFAKGEHGRAAELWKASLDLDPHNARVAFLIGWAHALSGQDREAIGAWRNAVLIDPALVPAHLALADTFMRLAQPSLAAQALRAGLAALPRSPELLDRLGRLEGRQ